MKKFSKVLGIMCAALIGVLGVALSGCEDKTGPEYLQVATNAYFPPFESFNGKKIVGVDVDIAEAIAKEMGYKGVNMIDMEFDAIIGDIQAKPNTVGIAGMTVTPERAKNVNFSDTYFDATQVVIYKGETQVFADDTALWNYLKGKKIGTAKGFTGDTMVTNNIKEKYKSSDAEGNDIMVPGLLYNSGASNVTYDKGALAVQDLVNGKVDVVVIDKEPAKVFAEKFSDKGVKVADVDLGTEQYAIAVNKTNTDLLAKINNAMRTIKENGTYQKIMDKYFGESK